MPDRPTAFRAALEGLKADSPMDRLRGVSLPPDAVQEQDAKIDALLAALSPMLDEVTTECVQRGMFAAALRLEIAAEGKPPEIREVLLAVAGGLRQDAAPVAAGPPVEAAGIVEALDCAIQGYLDAIWPPGHTAIPIPEAIEEAGRNLVRAAGRARRVLAAANKETPAVRRFIGAAMQVAESKVADAIPALDALDRAYAALTPEERAGLERET